MEGHGSDYTMEGPSGRKVTYNEQRREFVCTDCRNSINTAVADDLFMDEAEGWNNVLLFKRHSY